MQDFTSILVRTVAAGNLTEQEKGWWFMRGLPIEYHRHAMEQTGAIADEPSTLVFERLKEAVESDLLISKQASKTPLCLLDCPIWKPSACLLACWPQNHVCLIACLLIACQDSIELEVL